MSTANGWQPLSPATDPQITAPRNTPAFTRLARTHLLSVAADASLATALAGSLFFTLPNDEARGKVLLYLLLTMAPFSLLSPLIGPMLDRIRGGRRLIIIVAGALRTLLCVLMITDIKSLWFFPEAFGVLVCQKGYSVAKSALVPTTVGGDDELLQANSKLALLSGIGSLVGGGPGALALKLGGAQWSLAIAGVIYVATTVLAFSIRGEKVAAVSTSKEERLELHCPTVLLGASGMALLRAIVGFLTLFLAFAFHKAGVPLWQFGLVGAASISGSFLGALIAPLFRKVLKEESILISSLVAVTITAFASAVLLQRLAAATALAFVVGICAAAGKLAFDSIVQRDAPDANRGRSFARFETRFQVLWVIGALVAIAPMPMKVGYVAVLLVAGFAAVSYVVGMLAYRYRSGAEPTYASAAAAEIQERVTEVTGEAKHRVGRALRQRRR